MFFGILGKKNSSKKAKHLYDTALNQSRLEVFYSEYGVPDSVDGRFEMIALHVFLILHRLKQRISRTMISRSSCSIICLKI